MRKFFLVSTIFLAGCVHTLQNPLSNMSPEQLSTISDTQLCKVATNSMYIESPAVYKEARSRGFRDCSYGEIYCRNLGLKIGTVQYAQCRITYDQQQAQQKMYQEQQRLAWQQERAQEQAAQQQNLAMMFPRNNNYNCVSRPGFMGEVYTNCH